MLTNRFLIALGALSLLLVAMVISLPLSNTATSGERGRAADAARWTAMGEYYQTRPAAENLTRSRTADAARWEAMGRYYRQSDGNASLNLLRSRAADAARWTAFGAYHQRLEESQYQP